MTDKALPITVPGGGLIAPAEVVTDEGVGRGNNQLGALYGRLISDLSRAGVDFAAL